MVWTSVAMVVMVVVVGVKTLPTRELDPSETYLQNLSPEQLDSLVEVRLQKLKEEIAEGYEFQLRRHHEALDFLEQKAAVSMEREVPDQSRVRRDANQQQYWHSYNFDTYRDREMLVIKNITVDQDLESPVIDKIIPLNLWNFAAIYRTETKMGLMLAKGILRPLLVKNQWTKSLTGCPCNHTHYQVGGVANEQDLCACCHPESCRCPSPANTCVPCTLLSQASCYQHKPKPLLLETAVGFQYYLDYFDVEFGLQRILIAYYGTKLSFYRIDDDGVQLIKSENGLETQNFNKAVTHLGYGEMYKDNDGNITKERFLFSFVAGESSHRCYTINVGKGDFTIGLQFWKAKGAEMRTWQADGRVMVGILDNAGLLIKELTQSLGQGKYELRDLQVVRVGEVPILSWASFTIAYENYLVIVTKNRARILNLGKNYTHVQDLVPEGRISVFSAFLPMTMPWWRGKTLLLTGQGPHLAAYVWSGTTQRFHLIYTTHLSVTIPDWKITFGLYDSKKHKNLVLVQSEVSALTLRVDANLEDVEDPVTRYMRILQDLVQPLKDEYDQQSQVLEDVRNALQDSITDDDIIGNITVLNGIRVEGVLATGALEAETILLESRDSSGQVIQKKYEEDPESLSGYAMLLNTLNQTLLDLHYRLDDAVPIEGSQKLITGKKTILSGGLHVIALAGDRLAVGRPLDFQGQPLPLDEILSNIIRYNDTRVITGKKTFLQPISVGDLRTEYLDDIPVRDLVIAGSDSTITGTTVFSRLMAHTLTLSPGGTLGGLDVSKVILLNENVTLGTCNFDTLTVDNLTAISNEVNGVDIERLSHRTLTILGGTVQGSLIFTTSPSITTLHANQIMGVDVDRFMSTTVFKDKPTIMSGRLTIPSVETRLDVVVGGLVNGKKFPDDFIINTGNTIDFGVQWFNEVHFGSLSVGPQFRVDGLLVSDLVTLHTPQTITGLKKFAQGVYIEGDLDITSKIIDGINMDDLNRYVTNIKSESWKFDVVFEEFVSAPSVFCKGTVNGLDWASFVEDIVYDDVPSVIINSTKIFSNGLNVHEAIFHKTFNGESFNNLVNTGTVSGDPGRPHIITGAKTFLNNVVFDSLSTQLVAGVNLTAMAQNAVYLNRPGQIVYGVKTFTETLKVEHLVVTGEIKDLDISTIVTKSTDQVFTAPQSLRYANFSNLEVLNIYMNKGYTINGVDIVSLNERRLSLTSPGYYSGVLTVEGSVISHTTLTVGTVNGYKANQLLSNLVMKNESSIITGNVKFTSLTVDGPITTNNQMGANGFNISHISSKAIHLTDDVMMSGGATWDDLVFRSDVSVGGLVSGVNLQKLSQDVVYLDQTSTHIITGKKTFEGGLTIQGNLDATTINGIDLRTQLLTRHTEQVITAPYYFYNVEVKTALHILGLYNNHHLAGLASLGLHGDEVITGNVTFHGEASADHLYISGYYNGVNTDERMSDAISLYEYNVTVTGTKIFVANVTFQTVDVHTINYVPMKPYLQHVVLSNSVINFGHGVHVKGTVWAPSITADSVVVEGLVSGVDYDKLLKEAIYLDRNQTISGTLVFTKDVESKGPLYSTLLNHLSLATQYLTTHTQQTFSTSVVLGSANTAQVDVDGTVNSWRLPDEVAATMKAVGGQTVYGSVTFKGVVEVATNVQVTGLVGHQVKLDLSQQAVSLHHNTQIEGMLVFKSPLVVSTLNSPSGVINGVDVGAMLDSAWYLDEQTVLNVTMEFKGPVVFEGPLLTNNTMDSSRLEYLQHQLISAVTHHNHMAKNLSVLYQESCSRIEPLYKQLQHAIYEGDYFTAVYEDMLPHHPHASEIFHAFNTTFLVVSWKEHCETAWYRIHPDTRQLEPRMIDIEFRAHHWLFLGGTVKEVYVAAAASRDNGLCGVSTTSIIWKVTATTITKHRSLQAGERLSMFIRDNQVTLRVHATEYTAVYKLDLLSGSLSLKSTELDTYDLYTTTVTPRSQIVSFRTFGTRGTLLVDDSELDTVEAEQSFDDSVFLEEGGRLYLLLSITREDMHKDEFWLELYSVDITKRKLVWESVHKMAAKTLLTTFFVGSPITGSYMVIAQQEHHPTVVYTLIGATLREFATLSTPRVLWVEYVAVPSEASAVFPDHYLLLGQYNRTYVFTQLVMKGGSVPPTDHTCDQYSLYP